MLPALPQNTLEWAGLMTRAKYTGRNSGHRPAGTIPDLPGHRLPR